VIELTRPASNNCTSSGSGQSSSRANQFRTQPGITPEESVIVDVPLTGHRHGLRPNCSWKARKAELVPKSFATATLHFNSSDCKEAARVSYALRGPKSKGTSSSVMELSCGCGLPGEGRWSWSPPFAASRNTTVSAINSVTHRFTPSF